METAPPSRSAHAPPVRPNGARVERRRSRSMRLRAASRGIQAPRRPEPVDRLAQGLGWFSVALGAAELLAPRLLGRAIGAGDHPALTRGCGLREIAAGVGLLTRPDPAPWLLARVAGDTMDLAMLAAAMADADRDAMRRLSGAAVAVLAVTALDVYAARAARERPAAAAPGSALRDGSVRVEHSIAVNRSAEDCYRMWRTLENLPRFIHHVESVEMRDSGRSHWKAKGPAGLSVEWDAEITRDDPNAVIAWRSVEGSRIPNSGVVRFAPAADGRGTFVSLSLQYEPPTGALGLTLAKLFGADPEQHVREDLRRFKRLLETGEIPTTQGQSHGPRPLWYRAFGGAGR